MHYLMMHNFCLVKTTLQLTTTKKVYLIIITKDIGIINISILIECDSIEFNLYDYYYMYLLIETRVIMLLLLSLIA